MRKDLVMHAAVGAAMGVVLPYILGPLWGLLLAFGVAAAKESRDKLTGRGTPAWDDFLVTALFVAAGFAGWSLL
jgi:hypothetical protein